MKTVISPEALSPETHDSAEALASMPDEEVTNHFETPSSRRVIEVRIHREPLPDTGGTVVHLYGRRDNMGIRPVVMIDTSVDFVFDEDNRLESVIGDVPFARRARREREVINIATGLVQTLCDVSDAPSA